MNEVWKELQEISLKFIGTVSIEDLGVAENDVTESPDAGHITMRTKWFHWS
jgi:hypothetical protein